MLKFTKKITIVEGPVQFQFPLFVVVKVDVAAKRRVFIGVEGMRQH